MESAFNSSSASVKILSSEVVRYEVFLLQGNDIKIGHEDLESCRIKCLALSTSLTSEYIWNNEGFNLCIGKADGLPCLVGETDFGDFIEDEWLIVSILFRITKAYRYLACRVNDADGEFLLIEAAEHLPKWLNVDTSKNRVFIYGGHLHIVSQPQNPGEVAKLPIGRPTMISALDAVHKHPGLTQAHASIGECIQKRIRGYPERATEYVQNAHVFLPELVVKILDREPDLVSSAARAFYYRDPVDLRSCRVFKHFLPETRIWTKIPMNRCSYAQLMQQVFKADRRSGYTVPNSVGADFKGMDLGCRIAHGFEILSANCKRKHSQAAGNVFDEAAFEKYVTALRTRDYFCGEIDGSRRFNELMENARTFFSKFYTESSDQTCSVSQSIGNRIWVAKETVLTENPPLKRLSSATVRSELPEEDSDKWMYLNDEKMDHMLSEMKEGFEKLEKKNLDHKDGEELELNDLCKKMKNFVENMSGYEGVECPNSGDPDLSLDPDNFNAALKKLLNVQNDEKYFSDEFISSEEDTDAESEDSKNVEGITEVMQQMDEELAATDVGKSFTKDNSGISPQQSGIQPVDIDLNLVQNFLESCESETDLPGAATTLLHSIGLNSNRS